MSLRTTHAAPLLAAALLLGCTGHELAADLETPTEHTTPMTEHQTAAAHVALPPIDRDAPSEFETATFALG